MLVRCTCLLVGKKGTAEEGGEERPRSSSDISSSDGLLLVTPTYRSRVTLGDRSFQVAAPALWNVLPREIRSITDLGIFKCHLKTQLFREAFY